MSESEADCPECGVTDTRTAPESIKLVITDQTLGVEVDVPFTRQVHTCEECGFQWWQSEAEEAEALLAYWQRRALVLYDEVRGLRAWKRGIDEALNSRDGSYRP